MHDALGGDEVVPFTSKLNFKRAKEGSEFPWHQDYPYWYVAVGEDAQDVITAIVFLDDATADNGAVRVIPGSHRIGPVRRDPDDPTRFLTDPAAIDPREEIVLEVPAGSVLWFGSFLVHRSSPNSSGQHRRALLPSWQPAGPPPPARATVPPGARRRPALTLIRPGRADAHCEIPGTRVRAISGPMSQESRRSTSEVPGTDRVDAAS